MQAIPELPAAISREAFARLCRTLPQSSAENRTENEVDAMAAVAALRPADAFEARLAVQIIAADAHAMDSFRLAAEHSSDLTAVFQCRAQAALMMRQMQSALRTLQRLQAARTKTGASIEPPAPALPPSAPQPPAPQPEAIAEAEEFAARFPYRAIRIRAQGGLPTRLDFTPPGPEVVQAIATGTTPALLALDKAGRKVAA